jgi:signal transduction histidine kinase
MMSDAVTGAGNRANSASTADAAAAAVATAIGAFEDPDERCAPISSWLVQVMDMASESSDARAGASGTAWVLLRRRSGFAPIRAGPQMGHDDGMPRAYRRALLASVVVAQVGFVGWAYRAFVVASRADAYVETWFDWLLITSFFVGAVVAVIAGALLCDRQPGNRCGPGVVLLGVAMAAFWGFATTPWGTSGQGYVVQLAGVSLLRPLLVAVLLAWPTGRLNKWESRFVIAFGVSQVVLWFAGQVLLEGTPISVTSMNWLAGTIGALEFYVATLGVELVVLLVVTRRFGAASAPARSLILPVLAAAALLLAGDLLVQLDSAWLRSWTRNAARQLTILGRIVVATDLLRFWAIPLLLLLAAGRRHGVSGSHLVVELGDVTRPEPMSAIIARSLGDPMTRVLYPTGHGWVDGDGISAAPRETRQLTHVERGGDVVAAIEHGTVDRPAALEAAAGTLGLLAEHRALEARTLARVRELRALRTEILEAEDQTRQRLERDLHDGAQQQILALALQARIPDAMDDAQLAAEIRRVAGELLAIADGVTEGVIAERGLQSYLEALAAMAPVTVELSGHVPSGLDPPVAATAWFVASEAVGNAAKHASAGRVTVDVRPVGGVLRVAVNDDGCGGADPDGGGLGGLARRVRGLGGELLVHSPAGAGTALTASLPLGVGA